MTGADRGTVLPLVLLSFLLAGLLVTAGTAASAAFLAQRDLAGVCDGAALAGAAALDRAALARSRPGADGVGRDCRWTGPRSPPRSGVIATTPPGRDWC